MIPLPSADKRLRDGFPSAGFAPRRPVLDLYLGASDMAC